MLNSTECENAAKVVEQILSTHQCSRVFNQSTVDVFNFVTFFLSVTASVFSVIYTIYSCCAKRVKTKETVETTAELNSDGTIKNIHITAHSTTERHPTEPSVNIHHSPPAQVVIDAILETANTQQKEFRTIITGRLKAMATILTSDIDHSLKVSSLQECMLDPHLVGLVNTYHETPV